MLDLLAVGQMDSSTAVRIAEAIGARNPFITRDILDRFREAARRAT